METTIMGLYNYAGRFGFRRGFIGLELKASASAPGVKWFDARTEVPERITV